jgi:hypothetical protein
MEASDRQKRAIRWMLRKHPDTVRPLIAERGGQIESLTRKQASEILTVVEEKHPKDGGQKKDEQKKDGGDEQRNDGERELNDDEKFEQQKQKMGFRPGSKQEYIANALRANGMDAEATRKALLDKVGREPLLFTQNRDGERIPLPMGTQDDGTQEATQHGRLIKTIFAVRRSLLAGGQKEGEKKHEHEHKDEKRDHNREATDLLAWLRQLREFCEKRKADGHPIDEIGMRPVEYGAAMLANGIPLRAIKHAITMHYPPEVRRSLGVTDYNVQDFRPSERKQGVHAALPYCLTVINSRDFDGYRMPLALVGPKGTGKTRLARDISDEMGVPFGMVSMTSGTSPSAFNGRPMVADDGTLALISALNAMAQFAESDEKAREHAVEAYRLATERHEKGDTVMSQFVKCYGGGGVFLFDEMDAADENLLLGVNAALANNKFANPATGDIIEQHPDFIPIAGMNTLGLGAGRDYNSRNRLDAATLDRWNCGRVLITLDSRIEESMFWHIVNRKDA